MMNPASVDLNLLVALDALLAEAHVGRLAEALAQPLSLAVVKPPIDPGTYQEFLFYPRSREDDAASRWLREIIIDIGKSVDARAIRRRRRRKVLAKSRK
jgi:DNA-binding transcriptional LysR family regulator